MADLNDRDDALLNVIKIEIATILEKHKEEMIAASVASRNIAVEALTGHPWEKRHRVRAAIEWAMKQKDSHSKRQAMFWGAVTVLGVGHLWETIASLFHGKG